MNAIHEGPRNRRLGDRRAPRRRARAAAIALAALLAALPMAACETEADEGVPRSEFVEIVTSLREAERSIPESDSAVALFEARKAEILEEHGVTEEDLRAFLRSRGDDVEALQETWDTISERLRYIPGQDTLPADTLPADTLPADTLHSDTLHSDTLPSDPVPLDTILPDTAG